jgi:hypothetical protein
MEKDLSGERRKCRMPQMGLVLNKKFYAVENPIPSSENFIYPL